VPLPYLDALAMTGALSWSEVIDALALALGSSTLDDRKVPRVGVAVGAGELLLMPSETASAVGVKVVGVAPGNPDRRLPRIQGVFILMDALTLTPIALMDGTELTNIRTPGLSALAVRALASVDAKRLVVFGSGPQARGHIAAVCSVRPIESVRIVARDPLGVAALIGELEGTQLGVHAGTPADVADADIVVCATTARTAVFDGSLLAEQACVVAVGSHEPDARELDDTVFRRASLVVVEDRETALREAGDVIQAIAAGALDVHSLIGLRSVLASPSSTDGISVFKSVGMAWQDLAVAEAIWAAVSRAAGASA
jgi:ornithine cyclodeaminase/alanine dehydrogenase-like protein (mu-crystallin family)